MSQLEARFVKRGVWTDIEKGSTMGQTITTDVKNGTFVIALLAILASLAVTNLWHLVMFLYHQTKATNIPVDGLSRQQQVLYRSQPTPSTMFADTLKLWWVWRKKTHRALLRTLIPLTLAASFSIGLIAVGIFSSYIVDSTNLQVLVSSPFCGAIGLDPLAENFEQINTAMVEYASNVDSLSQVQSDDCYNKTNLPPRCNVFTRPNVPLKTERVECPFNDSTICADAVDGKPPAVLVDSDLVDMGVNFGMNLAPRDRVKLRKRSTWAVLSLEGHTRIMNGTDYKQTQRQMYPGEQMLILYYGINTFSNGTANETWASSLLKSNSTYTYGIEATTTYRDTVWNSFQQFEPLPELRKDNADVVLIHLKKNNMFYKEPVDDPAFSAHKPLNLWDAVYYVSDFPSAVLGCVQQTQFCISRDKLSDFCTDFDGLPHNLTSEDIPGASDIQLSILQLLVTANYKFDLMKAAAFGTKAGRLAGGSTNLASLPIDQWIQEVVGWESFTWASTQIVMTDHAIGPEARTPSAAAFVSNSTNKSERQLCHMQKMKSPGGFVNINLFGLTLMIVVSCLLTIIDLVILKFCIFLTSFKRALAPRIDQWIQDGVFQLQRRAYEANDRTEWERLDKEIPATVGNEKLCVLTLESTLTDAGNISENEKSVVLQDRKSSKSLRKPTKYEDEMAGVTVRARSLHLDPHGDKCGENNDGARSSTTIEARELDKRSWLDSSA